MTGKETFWSRRRAAVAAEEEAAAQAKPAAEPAPPPPEPDDRPEEEILAELDLPRPETVASGDDLKRFMAKAVPEYLRRRALRALWRSNPVLACLDGLNDYDGDYTNAATDAPGVATAYRVGKGLQAHIDAALRSAEPEADPGSAAEPGPESERADPAETAATEAPVEASEAADPDPAEAGQGSAEEDEIPRPRRMTFRFEGATT